MNNKAFFFCILSWVFFWVVAPFLNRPYVFDFVNACGLVVSAAVIFSYLPGVKAAYQNHENLEKAHYLILGVVATWSAIAIRLILLWIWRWQGEPAYDGMDSLVMAFSAWMLINGGSLHLLAPKVIDGDVPRSGWNYIFWTLAIGIGLGMAVVLFRYFFDVDPSSHGFVWKGF